MDQEKMTDTKSGGHNLLLRKEIRDSICQCRSCNLHSVATCPVPFSGPSPARIAVVGEAPGESEDRNHKPFVGPAGQKAREWLEKVQINPDDVAWLNVVSCWPNRTPGTNEIEACRDNLNRQLLFIQPEYILVLGGVAISAFHDHKLKISQVRGMWWHPDIKGLTTWALATYHPAYILRDPSKEGDALADLAYFRLCSMETALVRPVRGERCVKCGEEAKVWINDIGYCIKHWKQYYKGVKPWQQQSMFS